MQGSMVNVKSNTTRLQAEKKNLNVALMDYQKASDSVPHSWIAKSAELTGVNNNICKFPKVPTGKWSTTFKVKTNQKLMQSIPIKINTGIFQGDT
jgi:hypothetical protein